MQCPSTRYAAALEQRWFSGRHGGPTIKQKQEGSTGHWITTESKTTCADCVLDHGRGCKLIEQLKHVAGEKFDAALEMTNEMRGKFVKGPQQPPYTRPSPNQPMAVKQPGLEVANALARRNLAS